MICTKKKAFVCPTVRVKRQIHRHWLGEWVNQRVLCKCKTIESLHAGKELPCGVWKTLLWLLWGSWCIWDSHFCSQTASCSCSSDAEGSVTSVAVSSLFLGTRVTSSYNRAGRGSMVLALASGESLWLDDTSADMAAGLAPLSMFKSQSWSEGWGRMATSSWTQQ